MASASAPASARAPAPPRPAATPGPLTGVMMWVGGVVLALSNFMVVLDTSIANVSVPHIAGSLAISPDQGTWVITSYSVAEAIVVPLTGWLVQRFGAVRVYLLAVTGFAIMSALCGLSLTLGMLVACRVGQGLCGGPIMPLTQTLLLRIFPAEKRGQSMGLWAMTTVVAPIAGPLLGGSISDNWSWHWIFFINIPVAAICVVGGGIMLRGRETATMRQRIDRVGLALLVVWIGALQIMLDLGHDRDWFASPLILTLAIVAAIGFVAFLIWELTEETPVVNLRVFRHRGFAAASIVLAFTYGSFFAAIVVIPQWLQGPMGYTATWSGYATAWVGVFAVLLSQVVGRLVPRVDPRMFVSGGVAWMGMTMLLRAHWTSGSDYWTIALPSLLQGIGMPFFFVPLTIISLGSVEPAETASAAGLFSFLRTISAAFATSIATSMWLDGTVRAHAELAGLVNANPGGAGMLQQAGLSAEQQRGLLERLVTSEGAVIALTHLFEGGAVLLFGAALLVWIIPRRRGPKVDASSVH